MREHPDAVALYGRTLYWWTWDREANLPDDNPPLGVKAGRIVEPPELFIRCLTGLAAAPCTCSFMARTDVVRAIGAWDDEFPSIYDDQMFFSKMFLSHPVYISGSCLDYYRQHADSWCHQTASGGRLREERIAYLYRLSKYIEGHTGANDRVRRAVARELRHVQNPKKRGWYSLQRYASRKSHWLWLRLMDRYQTVWSRGTPHL
jgi:hypothetical protein